MDLEKTVMNHSKRIASIYLVGCCLSAPAQGELSPSTVPPFLHQGRHVAEIDRTDMLTLVEDSKANVEIVVMTRAPLLRFAAEELQAFIDRATGVTVNIVNRRSGTLPAIVLGDNPWVRQAAGIDVGQLPRDGFRIKRTADVIYIAGRDDPFVDPKRMLAGGAPNSEMGTLFGVYDFLERFVGARFYFAGDIGTVVPRTRVLSVPGMDIAEAPDFVARKVSYYGSYWDENADKATARSAQNLTRLRWRGETSLVPCCHSMARSGLSKRFAVTNPEYFAILPNGRRDSDLSLPGHPGQHCFSSKGLEDEVYKDAVAFLTGQPATVRKVTTRTGVSTWDPSSFRPGYFNIMPNDGYGPSNYCRCEGCWPYLGSGKANELIWGFICRIAKRLKQNGIPGYVTGMVYAGYRPVPPFEIPDNVLVMVAVMGPWKEKSPEFQAQDDRLVIDWTKKIGKKIWMWNYINSYGNKVPRGVPPISTKCIASYYKCMAPYMFGAYVQSDSDYSLFQYLNHYIIHKLFWNNATDVDALMADHHQKLFGPAATPMGAFFARLEDLWIDELLGEIKSTPLGPAMVKHTDVEVWEQIYTDEALGELSDLFDEAEKLARLDDESLARVKWFREHFFGKMLSVKNDYQAKKREVEDLVWQITPLPKGQTIAVDGKLDDAAWGGAESVTLVPLEGDDPLVKTTVLARWTPDTLYVAYNCHEPKIDNLYVADRKRDDRRVYRDTSVEMFLNPSSDRTTYYQFMITAKNAVGDMKISTTEAGVKKYDWEWDSTVKTATLIGKAGWTVEVAVPLQEIGLGGAKTGTRFVANFSRGRNLTRVKKEENQLYSWSPFLRRGFHDVPRFGSLEFVQEKGTASLIENGSFEIADKRSPAKGWHFPRDAEQKESVALDTTTYRDGGRSLRISDVSKSVCITQYLTGIEPSTRYLLTYFIKLKDVERREEVKRYGACVNLSVSPKDGQNLFFPPSLHQGTLSWTKQGFTFKTGPNAGKNNRPYARLYLYGSEGTVWFDDVRLHASKSPSHLLPTGQP